VLNPQIEDHLFEFIIPEGADVLEMDQL
jgi:outer membrane lipoprotein-sorting protein